MLMQLPVPRAQAAAPLGRKRSRSGTKRPPRPKHSDVALEHTASDAADSAACSDGGAGGGAGSGSGLDAGPGHPLEWVVAGSGRVRIAEAGAMRTVLEARPDAAAAADLGGPGAHARDGAVANGARGDPGAREPAELPALRITVEWAREGEDQGHPGSAYAAGAGAAAHAGRVRCRMRADAPVPAAALRHWEELAGAAGLSFLICTVPHSVILTLRRAGTAVWHLLTCGGARRGGRGEPAAGCAGADRPAAGGAGARLGTARAGRRAPPRATATPAGHGGALPPAPGAAPGVPRPLQNLNIKTHPMFVGTGSVRWARCVTRIIMGDAGPARVSKAPVGQTRPAARAWRCARCSCGAARWAVEDMRTGAC